MELQPRLLDVSVPDDPEAAVLVLHGGANRAASMRVSPTQLSVLRMIPIARRIARVDRRRLAVFRLLNSYRGWDTTHTPVHDARWAIEQIAERLGRRLPLCLVGHSLGGRAALLTVGEPEVRSVVALAPWVYPTDMPDGLTGRRILIVHGTRDRVARPDRAAAVAKAISRHAPVSYVSVEGGGHAMIKRHAVFSSLASDFAALTLLGAAPRGALAGIPEDGSATLT